MKKRLLTTSVCVLSAMALAAPLQAGEKKAGMGEEQMKQMMQLSTPGEHHKVLDGLVGEWSYKMSYRMMPGAPEQKTEGTAKNSWILDGRQLKQEFGGVIDMGGHKHEFKGLGFVGYDNLKNEYTSIWMDNMGTGTMVAKGSYDKASKTINESGTHSCAMRGEEVKFRSELTFVDENNYRFTMYDLSEAEPYKSLEINYMRK